MLAWALSVGVEVGAAEAAPGTRTEDWTPIGTDHVVLILDGGDDEGPSLAASLAAAAQAAPPPTPRPLAFEYSEGYRVRRKIHKYASFATLPLFVAQFAVGEKLYDQGPNADDGLRSTHTALGVGIGALFTVNTVTGVWNWSEGRKDPSHGKRRTLHGILMLVADAGFVATGLLAPESEEDEGGVTQPPDNSGRSTHRTVAFTSMGIATVSYLIMLFGN
jgi:hypothetical protein